MRLLFLVALASCADGGRAAPLEGERPVECDPPTATGSDDVTEGDDPPLATLSALLILVDPDCTSPVALTSSGTAHLQWRDGPVDHLEILPVEQRESWQRAGSTCRIAIELTYGAGPLGRAARLRACSTRISNISPASFADIPVTLDTLTIDDVPRALAWPAPWTDATSGTCRDTPPVDVAALRLSFRLDFSLPLSDWRRLHGTLSTLAVDLSIVLDP
jgi:hypothetical protein